MVATGDRLLMWAGYGGSATGEQYLQDTWSYTANGWRLHDATAPLGYRACGAWDAGRGVVVSFGGRTPGGDTAEIYEFNLVDERWHHRPIPEGLKPEPRFGAAMCYVPGVGCLGTGGSRGGQETWLWDGTAWAEIVGDVTPEATCTHVLVWDASHRVAVQYGGYWSMKTRQSTWEFDPTTMTWARGPDGLAPRHLQAFAYCRNHGVLLAGGRVTGSGNIYADLWCCDGGWRLMVPAEVFTPRFCSQMGWLPGTGLVMFGGEDGTRLGDTRLLIADLPASVGHWQSY